MEKRKAYILVEGIADKHFLEEYILHLGYEDKDFEINAVNGWCNLKNFTPKLRQEEDNGIRTAIIFDADPNPDERRNELQNILRGGRSPSSASVFLIPNDSDAGCLEDLLEHLVPSEYQAVITCWDEFMVGIKRLSPELVPHDNLPGSKTKFYYYASLLLQDDDKKKHEEKHKGKDKKVNPASEEYRPYKDVKYWNLDGAYLDPLKKFLEDLQN